MPEGEGSSEGSPDKGKSSQTKMGASSSAKSEEASSQTSYARLFDDLDQTAESEVAKLEKLSSSQRKSTQERTREEDRDLEFEKEREELISAVTDRLARESYTPRIFQLICIWLVVLLIILLLQGWSIGGFSLTNGVLIALLGGTTANVLGIFIIVAKYLFPSGE